MIELDYKNALKDLSTPASTIKKFLKRIESRKQGFYEILDDKKTVKKVLKYANSVKGKYKSIVVLGIGGSALGTICLQQSLKHLYENELSSDSPKLYVIDNIDPALILELEDVIDYKKTLFIIVTKSGSTPETLAQYSYYRNKTDEKKLDPKKHFVFITDPKNGDLRQMATTQKIPSFEIPQNVGGRFSVLTPVGLLPAALIGINIEKLIKGALTMRKQFLNENFSKNLPYQIATIQYLLSKKGKNINVMIPYAQKLIRFADWYRQLLAESIGKKLDLNGKQVHSGITPINALGVTDQHSQLQLYNEGPNDKFFIFIEVKKLAKELKVPDQKFSFNKLLKVEKDATAMALTQNNRPNITLKIDEINEQTLGELFFLFQSSIAFLGEFFNINTYDQPGVELSKKLTKAALDK
ncbi:MAG: glucose-6-phosphate isomerase [Patescibacteria group bacterium]